MIPSHAVLRDYSPPPVILIKAFSPLQKYSQLLDYMGRRAQDFSSTPMLVYWEMTQACGLACKHCRAQAMPKAHPLELNTEESKRFLNQSIGFGDPLPHLTLTGGDPLSRKDIYPLIDYANGLGLEVSITPSATQS
jgi:MoaA/NifB/PqqE/SkfB family radical SAM enzyme